MRWPWRHEGAPYVHEGKEKAKRQLEIAKVIEAEAEVAAHEHRYLLFKNHFARDARDAFGAGRVNR